MTRVSPPVPVQSGVHSMDIKGGTEKTTEGLTRGARRSYEENRSAVELPHENDAGSEERVSDQHQPDGYKREHQRVQSGPSRKASWALLLPHREFLWHRQLLLYPLRPFYLQVFVGSCPPGRYDPGDRNYEAHKSEENHGHRSYPLTEKGH